MQTGEKVIFKGPGGTITIDGSGITLDGVEIKIKGPLSQSSSGSGSSLQIAGRPAVSRDVDPADIPLSE